MKKTSPSGAPLPTTLGGPGESPGFLLWRLSNAWQRRQRAALAPFGLTHSQFVLLATATWFGAQEALTQTRLADVAGVDVMTASQVLRTLEKAGLVSRTPHFPDSRAKAIVVTSAGRKKAQAAIGAVEQADADFFAPVASRSKQLLQLFQDLAREHGPP
ncbi:MAG: winged helix-turn-helix transcriptional regulator [Gemmatimonadaceae bacterium]|nr:winged helix-turn-helix transcriptional regulator [Gemmatimonadaceae bacterium]